MEETEKRREAISFDNFKLIFFCKSISELRESVIKSRIWVTIAGQVSECQGSLTLNLEARAVHQHHEACHELWFALCQLLSICAVDGNVTQGCGAIILNISIWRVQ